MVVLNNKVSSDDATTQKTENAIATLHESGLTPLALNVPINQEGALPFRLLSNPFSNFLLFVNKSIEFVNNFKVARLLKDNRECIDNINKRFIIIFISTARNKGFL